METKSKQHKPKYRCRWSPRADRFQELKREVSSKKEVDAFLEEVRGLVFDIEDKDARASELFGGKVTVLNLKDNQLVYISLAPH